MTNRLPDLVQFYLKWHEIEGHTAVTVRDYRANLSLFLRHLEAKGHSLDISELTPFDILGHLDELKSKGRSPRYLRSRYQHVATFLNWAVQWEIIPKSPAEKLKPPKVPKVRKPFLKPEAFQKLLDLCSPPNSPVRARRQSMLWVLATTGIRHMEIASLMVEDVDWQRQLIRVRMGKGQKERYIPLHRQTQRALLRYMAQRADDLPQLWVTEEGRPLTYWGIGQDLKRLMQRAGIENQVKDICHIFRRTWAANAVRQGIPRQYTQAIGGWSTPQMLDHYTAAMQEEEGAIEAFRDFDPFGGKYGR